MQKKHATIIEGLKLILKDMLKFLLRHPNYRKMKNLETKAKEAQPPEQ